MAKFIIVFGNRQKNLEKKWANKANNRKFLGIK